MSIVTGNNGNCNSSQKEGNKVLKSSINYIKITSEFLFLSVDIKQLLYFELHTFVSFSVHKL